MSSVLCIFSILGSLGAVISMACHERGAAVAVGWPNLEWPCRSAWLLGAEYYLKLRATTGAGWATQRACDSRSAPSW